MAARISRRKVLSAGAALALAPLSSCSLTDSSRPPPSPAARAAVAQHNQAVRADLALRDAAVLAERHLLDHCQATLRRYPRLAAGLHPVLQAHRAHLRVLDDLWRSTPRQPVAPARGVPADVHAAVAQLRRTEERAVDARLGDCRAAQSGRLAQLLASLAASGAQSASLLAQLG